LASVLTKLNKIMEGVFKYMNGFFKGLMGLIMTLLGLAIAVTFLYGQAEMSALGMDVISNITGVIRGLADMGFVGLIMILIVWNLITSK
jgi:hypothetical protein